MKKRLLLICLILLCALPSCNEPHRDTDVHTPSVIRSHMIEYGNYIYSHKLKLSRYNRQSNQLSGGCMNPECAGDCILCKSHLSAPATVVDNKLFFHAEVLGADGTTAHLGYQNLISGDITVLKELPSEDIVSTLIFVHDGFLYYSCMALCEGGDKSNREDYACAIGRVSVDGATDEIVFFCEEETETLSMVVDGKIITKAEGKLYATDIQTGTRTLLFDTIDAGYKDTAGLSYCDGRLFFLVSSPEGELSEYKCLFFNYGYLISVNLSTGTWTQVIDEPVSAFTVTNERLYYTPFRLRHMYIPENYDELFAEAPEKATSLVNCIVYDDKLISCNLDGSDIKVVFTEKSPVGYRGPTGDFTVIDGILYGWICEYSDETHNWGNMNFGSLDLETGTVTYAISDAK